MYSHSPKVGIVLEEEPTPSPVPPLNDAPEETLEPVPVVETTPEPTVEETATPEPVDETTPEPQEPPQGGSQQPEEGEPEAPEGEPLQPIVDAPDGSEGDGAPETGEETDDQSSGSEPPVLAKAVSAPAISFEGVEYEQDGVYYLSGDIVTMNWHAEGDVDGYYVVVSDANGAEIGRAHV